MHFSSEENRIGGSPVVSRGRACAHAWSSSSPNTSTQQSEAILTVQAHHTSHDSTYPTASLPKTYTYILMRSNNIHIYIYINVDVHQIHTHKYTHIKNTSTLTQTHRTTERIYCPTPGTGELERQLQPGAVSRVVQFV